MRRCRGRVWTPEERGSCLQQYPTAKTVANQGIWLGSTILGDVFGIWMQKHFGNWITEVLAFNMNQIHRMFRWQQAIGHTLASRPHVVRFHANTHPIDKGGPKEKLRGALRFVKLLHVEKLSIVRPQSTLFGSDPASLLSHACPQAVCPLVNSTWVRP
jgi:hypothetical protein